MLADNVVFTALSRAPDRLGEWSRAVEELNARITEDYLPSGVNGKTMADTCGPADIRIDPRSSQARRTFTAAHELGHLMLNRSPVVCSLGDELPTGWSEIELLCDAIAGALLVPTSWIARLPHHPPGLDTLLGIANHFGISPSVFAIRLSNLERHCLLLVGRRVSGQWEWHYGSGRVPGIYRSQLNADALAYFGTGIATAVDHAPFFKTADPSPARPRADPPAPSCATTTSPSLAYWAHTQAPDAHSHCTRLACQVKHEFEIDVVKRTSASAIVWVRPASWPDRGVAQQSGARQPE